MTESLKEQRVHPVRPWSSCCYKTQVGMRRRHLDQKDQPKHMETVRMDPFMDGCVARCLFVCLLAHVLGTPAQCKSQGSGSAFHPAARRSCMYGVLRTHGDDSGGFTPKCGVDGWPEPHVKPN